MKLLVERLSPTPTDFEFEGNGVWWKGLLPVEPGQHRSLAAPFRFVFQAYQMGEDLYLEGEAAGSVELECSRCLARYRHPIREPFRLVLEPAGERIPADPEGAGALSRSGICLGDELDTGWFRGSEIDLGPFFREMVSLALPVKPLCDEDCAGLCNRCGAELRAGACECEPTQPDSPFAVLASLRGGPADGTTGGNG
jgi:uncharacterized protein